jgi:hypothetical protein
MAMKKRTQQFNFGDDTSPGEIDRFIDTPRPVKVWDTTFMVTRDGLTMPAGGACRNDLGSHQERDEESQDAPESA